MIIAVDADGTLFDAEAYPGIGEQNEVHKELLNTLIERQANGDKIILWTCREGKDKQKVRKWARRNGLIFDAVNQNVRNYKHARRKIVADVYLDDKAMQVGDFLAWCQSEPEYSTSSGEDDGDLPEE